MPLVWEILDLSLCGESTHAQTQEMAQALIPLCLGPHTGARDSASTHAWAQEMAQEITQALVPRYKRWHNTLAWVQVLTWTQEMAQILSPGHKR